MSTKTENQNGVSDEKKEEEDSKFDIPIISDIGIIYPPPEVRNIIEKTAEFVHKNGAEFEEKIRLREIQNQKFSFLNRNDPYFMYYKHVLYEYTLYPNREKAPQKPSFLPYVPTLEKKVAPKSDAKLKWRSLIDSETKGTPKPPTPHEFINDQIPLSAVDLDIVKITAQFVAKNGRQFLQSLVQRESKNYIFDFLKPQHNIYPFFIKLVDMYTKILAPNADMINTLAQESKSQEKVLEKIRERYEWYRFTNKDKIDEKEKMAGNVDWHEFVVVETITFREEENDQLPPPVTVEQLGARVIALERQEKTKSEITQTVKNIEDKKAEIENIEKPNADDNIAESIVSEDFEKSKTVKNYDPKKLEKDKAKSNMMVSPITGELVPAHKMDAHLKQALLDPKYKEQQKKYLEEKRQLGLMASAGPSITSHLKEMAQRRSDIFGPGHEETAIGKKLEEKEAPYVKKSAPVNFETAIPLYRPEKSVKKETAQTQLPPPLPTPDVYIPKPHVPVFPPQAVPGASFLPPPIVSSAVQDGRPKIDEPLIPEEEFLSSYGGYPINIQVRIPEMPDLNQKHGWQLQGQIQHLTINLSDSVLSLKNQLFQITGMPVSKQKILIGASRFAKDNLTLAYYNVHSNTSICLQLKERGGKR